MTYDVITVIYNPNSTGESERLAQEFAAQVKQSVPRQRVDVIATTHAGHGEELTYEIARSSGRPLIISSSGDGGYHDVINGALRARSEGYDVVTGLLPAGNANDHHTNLQQAQNIVEQIAAAPPHRHIDVLKITGTSSGAVVERYAHSYIGFGLTPYVGNELNRAQLNPIKEVAIVAKALWQLQPVRLHIGTRPHMYDSVIMSNIATMSKYLKVASTASVTDGKFEVTIFRNRGKVGLLWRLLRMVFGANPHSRQADECTLTTASATPVQADGEIIMLDAGTKATISVEARILPCVI